MSFVGSKSLLVFTDYIQDDTRETCLLQNMKSACCGEAGGGGVAAAKAVHAATLVAIVLNQQRCK